jgi:hypothetical protein
MDKDLPVVITVGITKVTRGWVVVSLETQGDKVLSKEILSQDPEPRGHAVIRAEVELRKSLARSAAEA